VDAKTFFIVGGSSGIGLEIVNQLHKMGHIIYVGSRTLGKLADVEGVRHIALDVTRQPVNIEGLPAVLDGWFTAPVRSGSNPFNASRWMTSWRIFKSISWVPFESFKDVCPS
jgi:hypothetical protein